MKSVVISPSGSSPPPVNKLPTFNELHTIKGIIGGMLILEAKKAKDLLSPNSTAKVIVSAV